MTFNLRKEFAEAIQRNRVDFMVRGMLSMDDRLFPLGTDTKVLSTIFELFTHPLIQEVASANGYQVEEAKQTIYPDFTLHRGADDDQKIAVDVKTTYRKGKQETIDFTLGSYTSFLRDNTKNILYPYDQYASHWIIGFVYRRRSSPAAAIKTLADRASVYPPYKDVEWFVQEKYRISGERPGSGNTANIGSMRSTRFQDFTDGKGPFATLGETVFRDYWANYGKTSGNRAYHNVHEYLIWKRGSTRR